MNISDYAACDAVELAHRIRSGSVSAREVLDIAYEVIDRLDGRINAFVSLDSKQAYAAADSAGIAAYA